MIKVGSDFSGVGAFNQALKRNGIEFEELFACDWDKYARKTFVHNYGEPKYFPENVYDRAIPEENLDIYMTSPPCQAFSNCGKRLGKDDERGILFFNSLEFIRNNQPRFFIFENVKGLLSDDGGKTFSEWLNYLGGKSVNGLPVLFPYEDSVHYHIYWKVINAKDHGIPQNRERVFIVGIRDDKDNIFTFPAEEHLNKKIKDVLDDNVDDRYFLSDKMLSFFEKQKEKNKESGNGFKFEPHTLDTMTSNAITIKCGSRQTDPFIKVESNESKQHKHTNVTNFQGNDIINTIRTGGKGSLTDKHNWDAIKIEAIESTDHENETQFSYDKKYVIRRLTPRECFRLMDFPDDFDFSCVSDTQAYKQAGNSICVGVLAKLIQKFRL